MKKVRKRSTKAPKKPKGALRAVRNIKLNTQRRKLLGKHYAAKYRVR